MRELLIGSEAFGAPESRILDYRFETKRGWFGAQYICIIVTVTREFRGTGRSLNVAMQDALEVWERHFLELDCEETEPEAVVAEAPRTVRAGADMDESGYMSSQVFAGRKALRLGGTA